MTQVSSHPLTADYAETHVPQIAPFDPTKKKKKKKRKDAVVQLHVDNSPCNSLKRDMLPSDEDGRNVIVGLTKKKLSIGTNTLVDDATGYMCDSDEENEEEGSLAQQSRYPFEDTERDYEYKELLQRVFGILHEHNTQPAEDKRRSVLKPPIVVSEGITNTVFVNFMDLCQTIHRQPDQLITFMLTELGTGGSLDGENRLVIRRRLAPSRIEDILQSYINEYVLCNLCRSPDTILSKEKQIVLQCELCGSERYVAPIGVGHGTRLGHRKTGYKLQ